MKKKNKSYLVIVISDTHCGSLVGLLPKNPHEIDSSIEIRPTKTNAWLAECFEDFYLHCENEARGREVLFVHNGDVVDGKPHGSHQVISDNPAVQLAIARASIDPFIDLATHVSWERGTAAHVGGLGNAEELLAGWYAEQTGKVIYSGNQFSHYRFMIELNGVLLDFSHHISGGGGKNAPLAARRTAHDIILSCANRRERIPDIVTRSHIHTFAKHVEGACTVVITPAWQTITEYGYRISAQPSSVGGVLYYIEPDGSFSIKEKLYQPSRNTIYRK